MIQTKLTTSALIPLAIPTLALWDTSYALAMGLGMAGGYSARIGISVEAKVGWPEIGRDLIVSILISGGSIITVLVLSALSSANQLGVAAISFAVTLAGTRSIVRFGRWLLGFDKEDKR